MSQKTKYSPEEVSELFNVIKPVLLEMQKAITIFKRVISDFSKSEVFQKLAKDLSEVEEESEKR
jgi:hypothetical protein